MAVRGAGARQSGPEILRHVRTGGLYEVLHRGARVCSYSPLADYSLVLVAQHIETGEIGAWSSFGSVTAGWALLFAAVVQTSTSLGDGAEIVIYRALKGGPIWVRPTSEMDDGRFEAIDTAGAPETALPRDEITDIIRAHVFRDLSSPEIITAGIASAVDAICALAKPPTEAELTALIAREEAGHDDRR